jgi:hypothetical protein
MCKSAETVLGLFKMRSGSSIYFLMLRRKEEHDHLSVDNARRKLEHSSIAGIGAAISHSM